jgi:hypothetical protein
MKESKRSETVDIKREDRFHEKNLKKVFLPIKIVNKSKVKFRIKV